MAERNVSELLRDRTQCRNITMSQLARVREAASKDKKQPFTALMHQVSPELLLISFYKLKRNAAIGVDGQTWQNFEENLERNIVDLHTRIQNGQYRPKPSRVVLIPKGDGSERSLSIQCVEDKIAQQAIVAVLTQIYDDDFMGFSYGFRPSRSQHDALDALTCGIVRRKVNWVLDLDIRQFFDTVEHEWLIRMLQHRVHDQRVIKLIKLWVKVGRVDQVGCRRSAHVGVPQGAVISPLLSNIYLHYVFDLWSHKWRSSKPRGDVIIVRYADDAVLGFQSKWDANEYRVKLERRLDKFGLTLHGDKTRLLRFGRFATQRCAEDGLRKPETFDFLGFTHVCTTKRNGEFQVGRRTSRARLVRQIRAVHHELRRRLHFRPLQTLKWLASVMQGHMNYYSVPGNIYQVTLFRDEIVRRMFKILKRRSQRSSITWSWFCSWVNRLMPKVHVVHLYPEERFFAKYSQ